MHRANGIAQRGEKLKTLGNLEAIGRSGRRANAVHVHCDPIVLDSIALPICCDVCAFRLLMQTDKCLLGFFARSCC